MSRPMTQSPAMTRRLRRRLAPTTSMKRLTRSPSTAFQVSPSILKWVPITQPSAMREDVADIVDVDAGIGEQRSRPGPPRALA